MGELCKIVAGLSAGLSGAKQANEQLVQELSTLRALLGSANEEQLAAQHHLARLEQELRLSQSNAERERQFLTEQHDAFLASLLEEHEQALRERPSGPPRLDQDAADAAEKLRRAQSARVEAEAARARAREALSQAVAERDEARARADKRERERDELRAEASQLRARLGTHRGLTTAPPPATSGRPPSFRAHSALQLDTGELDSTLHTRSASSGTPSVEPRLASPAGELPSVVYTRQPPSHPPIAEPFPRESTRPGVGGPKPSAPPPPSFGPPPSGWTPPPPPPEPAKAPRTPVISAASLPPGLPGQQPILKQKPHPATRPLVDYSLGGDGLPSETLEGARLSSKPPRR